MGIRREFGVVLALGALAGACFVPDEELGLDVSALMGENALSVNALSVNALSVNALSVNALSVNSLGDGRLAFDQSTSDLADTPSGREVLTYVARCALPEGIRLVAEVEGVVYEFPGSIGLAAEWADGGLSDSGQRWVSACLLAHANYYGVPVPLSLRGAHPALAVTPDELALYTAEEGAFYGNLFGPAPVRSSCVGRDAATPSASPYLADRICATSVSQDGTTACGFEAVGQCKAISVCKTAATDGSGYGSCRTRNDDSGRTGEVITVYLPASY